MATPSVHPGTITRATQPAAAPWFKTSQRIFGRDWPIAWLFILPMVVLIFGLIGYPFVRALYLSFFNVVGIRQGAFVGLGNYIALFQDDFFRRSVAVTFEFTFWSEIFKFALGLTAALLLHNLPRGAAILGGIVLLPYIIPSVVRVLAWRILLDPLFGGLGFILVNVLHVTNQPPVPAGKPADRAPLGHHGQRLGGHPVLHHPVHGRPQVDRQGALRGGQRRRRNRLAALPARHPARVSAT